MVTYSDDQLDRIFSALADRTRRGLLRSLGARPQPVKDLAAPYAMSRPAISKHLRVLEEAGLIRRSRDGRLHRSRLHGEGMRGAQQWLEDMEQFWEGQIDRFQRYVESSSDAEERDDETSDEESP